MVAWVIVGDRSLTRAGRPEQLLIKKSSSSMIRALYITCMRIHQRLFTGDTVWEKGSVSCNFFLSLISWGGGKCVNPEEIAMQNQPEF